MYPDAGDFGVGVWHVAAESAWNRVKRTTKPEVGWECCETEGNQQTAERKGSKGDAPGKQHIGKLYPSNLNKMRKCINLRSSGLAVAGMDFQEGRIRC